MSVDWMEVSPTYLAHTVYPLSPDDIDLFEGRWSHRLWATIMEIRDQAFQQGYEEGLHQGYEDGWSEATSYDDDEDYEE